MDIHRLERIFDPQRIALIGVTANPRSVGGKVLGNLVSGGFRGVVYPVNPSFEAVLGIQCYPDIRSLPKVPDLGIICTPAPQVPDIVRQCGEAGILGLIVVSAGFKETGAAGKKLEEQIETELKRFPGMRIIGPNCLGIIVPGAYLNASFAAGIPKKGSIAFISQSGALCASVLDWAIDKKIGFSYFVSIGNTLDVDFGDLIDYFGEDEQTRTIILYMESISRARALMTAARSYARSKPIIVYKAGRFPQSAEVAASHTGALATEDGIFDAAFQRMGISRVRDIGEIFDYAELIGRKKIPRGPRLCIVTNAGGPGVIATDALIGADGVLAALSDETMEQLNAQLPDCWSHANPVDVLGDARPKRISRVTEIVLQDPGVDAVLIILTPQAMTNPTSTARAVGEIAGNTAKPILAAWMGGGSMKESIRLFNEAGVPVYDTPAQAVRAFMILVEYSRNLETLYETPRDVPVHFTVDRDRVRQDFFASLPGETGILPEHTSKSLIKAYGIPVTLPQPATDPGEAVKLAGTIGYPVVLKIHSPDISHKTDVGGVALNLENADMVREAFQRIVGAVKAGYPRTAVQGVTVQPMIRLKHAVEMILGIKKDPVFGTVMLAGMGGIQAELFKDRSLGFPPLNERLARRMLESLKIWPLLTGYRGLPPANVEGLIEVIIRLSYLAADYPEISELDINPLLVHRQEVVALDARIVIDRGLIGQRLKPFGHLALRPYPEEFVSRSKLKDGSPITLRPIKPEDEPIWMDLLAGCSRESIYARFRSFYTGWQYHREAIRFCYIDYDREMAIVAELDENGQPRLAGVGRLVADPDLETAEYAVLIGDPWQNQGLGSILTEYCLGIARQWGVKQVVAQTTSDNRRMVEILKKLDFHIDIDPTGSLVDASKPLS